MADTTVGVELDAEGAARWQRFVETGNVIPHAAVERRIDELVAGKRSKARAR